MYDLGIFLILLHYGGGLIPSVLLTVLGNAKKKKVVKLKPNYNSSSERNLKLKFFISLIDFSTVKYSNVVHYYHEVVLIQCLYDCHIDSLVKC